MTFCPPAGVLALLVVCGSATLAAQGPREIVWTFDRLDTIGGVKTTRRG